MNTEVANSIGPGNRDFAMHGIFDGDGTSVADVPIDELMAGFGRDAFRVEMQPRGRSAFIGSGHGDGRSVVDVPEGS